MRAGRIQVRAVGVSGPPTMGIVKIVRIYRIGRRKRRAIENNSHRTATPGSRINARPTGANARAASSGVRIDLGHLMGWPVPRSATRCSRALAPRHPAARAKAFGNAALGHSPDRNRAASNVDDIFAYVVMIPFHSAGRSACSIGKADTPAQVFIVDTSRRAWPACRRLEREYIRSWLSAPPI
jgi:hypothetical protein